MLHLGASIRVHVYVDGFNLYYGALKGTAYRWLNLVELARQVLPAHVVVEKVKYFTARVSGANDPDEPRKQQAYLTALQTLPEVEVFYGSFLSKTTWRPIVNLPIAGATVAHAVPYRPEAGQFTVDGGTLRAPAQLVVGEYAVKGTKRPRKRGPPRAVADALIAEVHTMEEKGSDVNLAAHLLNDAWSGAFEAAAVISNDTDLVTPIQMVTQERGKPVFCICPREGQVAPQLAAVATYTRHIRPSMLAASQFPAQIGSAAKPQTW